MNFKMKKRLYCISEDTEGRLVKNLLYNPIDHLFDDEEYKEYVELDGMKGILFEKENFREVLI